MLWCMVMLYRLSKHVLFPHVILQHHQVQDAILHNKRIFEQRMMSEGRALQRRVLHGWLVLMQQKAAKRSRLARAAGRLQRGLLLRVFYSWKDELHHVDKTLVMNRKVGVLKCQGVQLHTTGQAKRQQQISLATAAVQLQLLSHQWCNLHV